MIISLRLRLHKKGEKGSTLVNLLFLIIILAILLMNADTIANLAATPADNFQTRENVRKIVRAVNSYKVSNGGSLPQNNTDIEGILNQSLSDLGPAGADYILYYKSDLVRIEGISPTDKIYRAEI